MRPILAFGLVAMMASAGCLSGLGGGIEPEDFLRDSKYTTWIIEIDSVSGQAPSSDVLSTLRSRLNEVVHKDSIQTQMDDTIPGRATWSRGALDDLHREYADQKTGGSKVVTHVVYLDGEYEQRDVLGVAVGHHFVAIFAERITDACTSNPLCLGGDLTTVRKAVLVHEFGHILGLVDNGVPMVNDHGDGTGHSSSQNSVMYRSAETTGIFGLANIPTTFDSNDKLDLCRAGGKGSC